MTIFQADFETIFVIDSIVCYALRNAKHDQLMINRTLVALQDPIIIMDEKRVLDCCYD